MELIPPTIAGRAFDKTLIYITKSVSGKFIIINIFNFYALNDCNIH